jgi:hypothetical protein
MGTAWERHGMCESALNVANARRKTIFRHVLMAWGYIEQSYKLVFHPFVFGRHKHCPFVGVWGTEKCK